MLKELTCGEARTIDEMAKVGGCSYDNASKHLARLLRAGLIVRGRGRLLPNPCECGAMIIQHGNAGSTSSNWI